MLSTYRSCPSLVALGGLSSLDLEGHQKQHRAKRKMQCCEMRAALQGREPRCIIPKPQPLPEVARPATTWRARVSQEARLSKGAGAFILT